MSVAKEVNHRKTLDHDGLFYPGNRPQIGGYDDLEFIHFLCIMSL